MGADGVQQEPGPAAGGGRRRGNFDEVLREAGEQELLSEEHFTVPRDAAGGVGEPEELSEEGAPEGPPPEDPGNPTVDFHKEKRTNETHQSTTDPDARLARKGKGKEAKLSYAGHVLMENRNGLVVNVRLTQATGPSGKRPWRWWTPFRARQVTVGADKNYDAEAMVQQLRERKATPHVAQNQERRRSAIDSRTTRHPGYQISQRARKKVEESFGWMKTVGLLRKLRHRGLERVGWIFTFTAAAFNLVRIRNLVIGAVPPRVVGPGAA